MPFTRREYDLLLHLARHPHQVLTRGQLLREVWGYEAYQGARTVDVHVRRVRQKLAGRGPVITTVRGVGYRLDADDRLRVTTD
ncbi:winged helix-turn-helix domain-containing protein [Micromonospora purpureochromogenes]|uniref:winged helix-turn-helix domain-containing protein n=1 Tax=Micromonospora purpureochromogenes TaxID=47872 RepID=UPI003F4CDE50